MKHTQLQTLAELCGWTDCILEPWRNPDDKGYAHSAVLRQRFDAGGGIPWHGRADRAAVEALDRDGWLIGAGQTRGRTWRLTAAGDDLIRQAIGVPDRVDGLRALAALIDLEQERGERWTPETVLGRRLGLLTGPGWGVANTSPLALIQSHVSPMLPLGAIRWTTTMQGHVIYAVVPDAPTPPEPVRHDVDGADYKALHGVYTRAMRTCRAAVRKLRGPGFDGELGPIPAIVSAPCMKGWDITF